MFTVPLGNEFVEITRGAMLTVTTNAVAAEDCPNESLTVRVKLTSVLEVGVPETMPVLAASDSPLEGSPVALQVRVPVPVAWKVKAYAEPTVAGAAVTCACVVEIAGGAGLLIVRVRLLEADLGPAALESVTVTVMLPVPLAVAVPEIAPVLELIDRPVGNPVALQVSVPAPPVAANEKL